MLFRSGVVDGHDENDAVDPAHQRATVGHGHQRRRVDDHVVVAAARLGDELSALKAQQRANPTPSAASGVAGASGASSTASAPAAGGAATEDPGVPRTDALFSTGEEPRQRLWPWTLAAALIGFGLGFGLGALMLDRHIRRKYGGLRIY